MEQDKQQRQQNLIDLSQGMSLALIGIFAVNRTVQVWSRYPGSTGSWFYGWVFFVGLLLQAWYCQINTNAVNRADFVSIEVIAFVSILWFAIHGVIRSFHLLRGLRLHSYEPGQGVFHWMFPTWNSGFQALASDVITAVLLSIWLWLIGSPVLSSWYTFVCFWLLIGHCWGAASQARRRQIWIDSQVESENWSHQIKE